MNADGTAFITIAITNGDVTCAGRIILAKYGRFEATESSYAQTRNETGVTILMNMQRGCLFLLLLVAGPALSQTVEFDDDRSKIIFTVRNLGWNVSGKLSGLSGVFVINEDNPDKSHFEATVRAETVDTGVGLRDKHLRQENYLNAEKYPVIRIESKSVSRRNHEWICDALVTIKNVTKRVMMPFTIKKNNEGVYFKSNFTLNRLDFHVGGKSFSMDDTVHVRLEIAGRISDSID